jgi:hypothetical protein
MGRKAGTQVCTTRLLIDKPSLAHRRMRAPLETAVPMRLSVVGIPGQGVVARRGGCCCRVERATRYPDGDAVGMVLMDDLRAADGQAYLGARVAKPGDVMSCRLFQLRWVWPLVLEAGRPES